MYIHYMVRTQLYLDAAIHARLSALAPNSFPALLKPLVFRCVWRPVQVKRIGALEARLVDDGLPEM